MANVNEENLLLGKNVHYFKCKMLGIEKSECTSGMETIGECATGNFGEEMKKKFRGSLLKGD